MDPHSAARGALRGMIDGYRASQIVCVAAELGLPDLVRSGASSCADLAAHTGASQPALRRLLRALCALGVFDRAPPDGVALNQLSELLLRDAPRSLNPWARTVLDQFYASWGALRECVVTGRTGFESVHGLDPWTHRTRNAKSGRLFNEAMASAAGEIGEAVLDAYDFSRVRNVVDIGGGDGTFSATLLHAHRQLVATVLDASVPDRPPIGLEDRMSFVRGDFLISVPSGSDCYLLSRVLHDWDDRSALLILQNAARAMPAGGALLLVERVLPLESVPAELALSDINMMVMNGGRERTLEELSTLLVEAGLRATRVIPTAFFVSVIEAKKSAA